jgi:pilus assembly protein CpaB
MKANRLVALGVAALLAVGIMFIVHQMMDHKSTTTASAHTTVKPIPTARILVAKRDLKVGDRLGDADLDWRAWPVADIKPDWTREDQMKPAAPATPASGSPPASGAPAASSAPSNVPPPPINGTKQVSANGGLLPTAPALIQAIQGGPKQTFIGAVVREAISAGEPVTLRRVVRAGDSGYLAVVLAPGKRAMSIPVTVDNGAGGFILPGDRVDVILTRKLQTGKPNDIVLSQTVLRNMKVLAIDQTTQTEKDAAAVVGATATLEVSGDEAEALASSKAAGTLSLTLRSYADANAGHGRNGASGLARFGGENGDAPGNSGVKVFRYGEAKEEPGSQQ